MDCLLPVHEPTRESSAEHPDEGGADGHGLHTAQTQPGWWQGGGEAGVEGNVMGA